MRLTFRIHGCGINTCKITCTKNLVINLRWKHLMQKFKSRLKSIIGYSEREINVCSLERWKLKFESLLFEEMNIFCPDQRLSGFVTRIRVLCDLSLDYSLFVNYECIFINLFSTVWLYFVHVSVFLLMSLVVSEVLLFLLENI